MLKIEFYADCSGEDGIVVEKRSVRLKAFPWKATSKAYALPLNFNRKQRYIQKKLGATAIGRTIHPRSGHLSTLYI
ncbi:MAG TPA: hypothetical protein VGI33_10010 [Paenibacillus sp.]